MSSAEQSGNGRRTPKMSLQVANLIAAKVLDGGLTVGEQLPTEREMVAEYGVARTTVREALRLLESYKLVTIKSGIGGGPVATRPSLDSLGDAMKLFFQLDGATIGDVLDVRLMLEPAVARAAAAHVTPDQVSSMQDALDSMRTAPEDNDRFQADNAAFQRGVYEATGNPALRIVMETLWRLVHAAEPPEHPMATRQAAVQMQQAVLDAIAEGDGDTAAEAMSAFTQQSARYYHRRLGEAISRPVRWQL